MKSGEVIQAAVQGVGVKKVAAAMNVSASLVYKWCEGAPDGPADESSGTLNPLDRVAALWDSTRDAGLIDWLCQRAGGTFVPNPFADANIDAEYVERTQKIIKDFSELLAALSQSMIDDGRVDQEEARDIRRHWQLLKRHGESLVMACEQGLFDRKGDAARGGGDPASGGPKRGSCARAAAGLAPPCGRPLPAATAGPAQARSSLVLRQDQPWYPRGKSQ